MILLTGPFAQYFPTRSSEQGSQKAEAAVGQTGARWISAYSASSSAAQVTRPDDGAAAEGLRRVPPPEHRSSPAGTGTRSSPQPGLTQLPPSHGPLPARGARPPAPPRYPAPLPPLRPAPSGTAGPQPGRPLCPAQGKACEAQRAALNPGLSGLAFPCYCSPFFFFFFFSGNFPFPAQAGTEWTAPGRRAAITADSFLPPAPSLPQH